MAFLSDTFREQLPSTKGLYPTAWFIAPWLATDCIQLGKRVHIPVVGSSEREGLLDLALLQTSLPGWPKVSNASPVQSHTPPCINNGLNE